MINHGQKGIFVPARNQVITGRNANIQPTMFKRKQIFEKASTQRFQTPFSGYSFTGSSVTDNSSLARSQVSQFSQQNVIRLIKQELQKNGLNSMSETSQQSLKNKNQLNILRIQIRSLKQSYHQLNKSFKRKIQQQNDSFNQLKKQLTAQNKDQTTYREQMSGKLVQKIKQVEQDIAIKMRMIFSKMQQDLRKQLTNYANRQFVPTSFLDDLDKQLTQLDDRISIVQNEYQSVKVNGNKDNMTASRIQKDTSAILSSGSQLKLNKFQRDIQYLKKVLDQKSQKIKQLDQLIVMYHQSQTRQMIQVKKNIEITALLVKDSKKQIETSKQTVDAKVELYRKNLIERIEIEIQNVNRKIQRQSIIKQSKIHAKSQISQKQNITNTTESTSIILDSSSALTQSLKSQDTRQVQKINAMEYKDQKQSPKKGKKITITFGNMEKVVSLSPKNQQNVQSQRKQANQNLSTANQMKESRQQKQFTKFYKVDKEGYLMDNQNKYILSPSNSMIYIPEQQISAMQKANLIKIQRWSEKN